MKHEDQPSLRMQAKIIRKEINETCSANSSPIKNQKENDKKEF